MTGDGPVADPAPPAAPGAAPASRAGRNLPVAIGVGLVLGAVVLLALFLRKEVFVGFVAVAAAGAVVEVGTALRGRGLRLPLVPLVAGGVASLVAAYLQGPGALVLGVAATCAATLLWQRLEPATGAGRTGAGRTGGAAVEGPAATLRARDGAAAVFAAGWVPLLAGFAVLLLAPADGPRRVVVFVLVVVCSDTGGYVTGVLFGRHPLAPSVSPKKSWEGLGGSAAWCLVAGLLSVVLLLHGRWWVGVLVGLAAVATATLGDLSESILKRDLGIKDMGSLLPGHGGVLDRLDSMLATAPVVWLLLSWLVPVAH